jgi:hypothetical protein
MNGRFWRKAVIGQSPQLIDSADRVSKQQLRMFGF